MTNFKLYQFNALICILVSFVICGFQIEPVQAQSADYPYKIKSLTVDEGLSHTDANDIAQDQQGFIWIATYFGLDRFDGYSIKQFYNSNEPLKNAFKNRLTCVHPDSNGDIWLGTEGGLQRFEVRSERYTDYHCADHPLNNFLKIFKPAGDKIYALGGDQLMLFRIKGTTLSKLKIPLPAKTLVYDFAVTNNNLFLATSNGLMELGGNGQLTKIKINGLGRDTLKRVVIGEAGELIITSGYQIFAIAPEGFNGNGQSTYIVKNYYVSSFHREIKDIIRDPKNTFWVNENGFLTHLDANLKFKQVFSSNSSQQPLNSNALTKLFVDRSQCMWVCMYGGGVNYFDLNEKPFYTLRHIPGNSNSLSGNFARSVLAEGNLIWIGTTNNGLNRYDRLSNKYTFYNSYNTKVRLKNDAITSLVKDNDGNLWIGSIAGIEILNKTQQRVLKPLGSENFPKYAIEVLTKDCFGNIWFGNHTDQFGVIYKDVDGAYHVKYYGEGFFILADKKSPQLMISSTHGLKRLVIDKNGDIKSQVTYTASNQPNSLSSNYTYPIVMQNDSTYWIGTIGGGLNKLLFSGNKYTINHFGNSYGIFNDVESLELDNSGNVWMGGNGLERFNTITKTLIRYDKNDGLQGNSFKVGSSFKGQDGCLYFGGINGLNYFFPSQIRENPVKATPRITNIQINNRQAIIRSDTGSDNSIRQSVSYCKSLNINYNQNNFVIFFSAMHFANPLKCKYRYKLAGFDKDWRYTNGKNPSAAYNNIEYREYTFQVQASNDDGIWSNDTAQLSITITPPWWKSIYAKIAYTFMAVSVLVGIYLYRERWHMLKRDMEIGKINERKREEIHLQREELHQQQLVFFTNISHEFRTPLTLIVGPLEHLIHENKDIHLNSTYQLILRNAKRLMNLITELMNFKKVADSVIKLQIRPLDVYQFCADLFVDFDNIALNKDISYRFINNTGMERGGLLGWFDVQVLEKILFNLLNNAFKYTESYGKVTLEIFFELEKFKPSYTNEYKLLNPLRADNYIYFRVADTGIGISSESIANIFERYYRISSSHLGSGIGLALVKSLVQLHKGDVYVYSERLAGTEIIVGIPWGENNYSESEKAPAGSEAKGFLEPVDKSLIITPQTEFGVSNVKEQHSDSRILIVEDNSELRKFLKQVFEKHYYIYEAEDGQQGLKIAAQKVPDVIISDVMMPIMDGIELCRLVKNQFETRHIPFVILSAKNAIESRIQGMEYGADFYFAKPINIDLLLLTIKNIIAQKEIAKQRFLNDYLSNATELVQLDVDKSFFDKLIGVIDQNLQSTDLDVEFLCKQLFVSRTKLYQKIKSISGQSVGEFIRTIRLKKSIEIMTHEDVSMGEVAERIGMQSSSNFSRTFRKEYGKSPLQFMQALKNRPSGNTNISKN